MKSGTPTSAMVGTFGNVGQRCAEVTASARIVPDSICETYEARLSTANVTSPASIAGMVWAAPRNGTWIALMPVRAANKTPERCGVVPGPGLPIVMPFDLAFAHAMKSLNVLAGTCWAATTATFGSAARDENMGQHGML